jgi:hypothetical protein
MQDVSATDRLLGRQSSGAGVVEEITCTAAGRALIDDADAAAQRTTLGLAAGGAGDIWVEKAGDTMTGTLTLSRGSTTSDAAMTATVTHSYTSGVGAVCQMTGTVAPTSNSTGEARGFYAVNIGSPSAGVTITSCFGSRIEGLRFGSNQDGLVTNVIGNNAIGSILTATSSASSNVTNSYGVQGTGALTVATPLPGAFPKAGALLAQLKAAEKSMRNASLMARNAAEIFDREAHEIGKPVSWLSDSIDANISRR